jgi:hypothetical protein
MANNQLWLYPFFIQYAKDVLGGTSSEAINLIECTLGVNGGPALAWGEPALSPDVTEGIGPAAEKINTSPVPVEFTYSYDRKWSTLHQLTVTIEMSDATEFKTFVVPPLVAAAAPVGNFPPPVLIDLSSLNSVGDPQNIDEGVIGETINIPAFFDAHVQGVVEYTPYSATLYATYTYVGKTKYQFIDGDTTKTTVNFYGIDEIIAPYAPNLPNVTVKDGYVEASCYVTFVGNLFKAFKLSTNFPTVAKRVVGQ